MKCGPRHGLQVSEREGVRTSPTDTSPNSKLCVADLNKINVGNLSYGGSKCGGSG